MIVPALIFILPPDLHNGGEAVGIQGSTQCLDRYNDGSEIGWLVGATRLLGGGGVAVRGVQVGVFEWAQRDSNSWLSLCK
jgi:hypothetical protein